jgi:hypothetical protein
MSRRPALELQHRTSIVLSSDSKEKYNSRSSICCDILTEEGPFICALGSDGSEYFGQVVVFATVWESQV